MYKSHNVPSSYGIIALMTNVTEQPRRNPDWHEVSLRHNLVGGETSQEGDVVNLDRFFVKVQGIKPTTGLLIETASGNLYGMFRARRGDPWGAVLINGRESERQRTPIGFSYTQEELAGKKVVVGEDFEIVPGKGWRATRVVRVVEFGNTRYSDDYTGGLPQNTKLDEFLSKLPEEFQSAILFDEPIFKKVVQPPQHR